MELTDEMLISTFKASGLTQKEFCEVHNISLEKLRYHLYRKGKTQIKANKRVSLKTGPTFITFENSKEADLNKNKEMGEIYTIIRGRFDHKELASIIQELEKTC